MQGATHIKAELEQAKVILKLPIVKVISKKWPDSIQHYPRTGKTVTAPVRPEQVETRLLRNKVTEEEIAEVVSKWTGIPSLENARR